MMEFFKLLRWVPIALLVWSMFAGAATYRLLRWRRGGGLPAIAVMAFGPGAARGPRSG
jgi:hypothetical protein